MVVQVVGEAKHHSTCKSSDNHENICCHICHPNIRSKQFLVFICRVHFVCVYECMSVWRSMYVCICAFPRTNFLLENKKTYETFIRMQIFLKVRVHLVQCFLCKILLCSQASLNTEYMYVHMYIEYLYLQWNETNRIF